jgi:hypothetical protein
MEQRFDGRRGEDRREGVLKWASKIGGRSRALQRQGENCGLNCLGDIDFAFWNRVV